MTGVYRLGFTPPVLVIAKLFVLASAKDNSLAEFVSSETLEKYGSKFGFVVVKVIVPVPPVKV